MSVLQAILLGIVQGITEFLPVSSFGHLAAIENAMGITRNTAVLFEVLLHVGTLAAIFFAFHEDIRRIGEIPYWVCNMNCAKPLPKCPDWKSN